MKQLQSDIYYSPIGEIFIVADGEQLCFLDFRDNDDRIDKFLKRRFGSYELTPVDNLLDMQARLKRYFEGDWNAFHGLSIATDGTAFQQKVWRSLQTIDPGSAISYAQLADSISQPSAVRAVASANARNPVAIAIPCHRVIGKDGSLRGYAGGMDRKAWLLRHEGLAI